MPSTLIHGGTKQEREQTALKVLAKEEVEEGTSLTKIGEGKDKIGIKEIKALLPHLHVRTKSKHRGVLISEAQRLTTAAQNALLKTLEEPPPHLTFVLTTPHPRLLLTTITSRCLIIEAQKTCSGRSEEEKEGSERSEGSYKARGEPAIDQTRRVEEETLQVGKLLTAKPGKRLTLFEETYGYGQKSVFTFLDTAETLLKRDLNQKNTHRLTKLWRAKKLLRNETANPKLIVDELLLSW